MIKKFIQLMLLVLLGGISAFGQTRSEEFSIDFIDVRKGLLSNFVTKTVSDDDNIKYFATEGGVSKYDGYNFTSIRPGNDFPELENENIETLFKDSENNIWIGTKEGGVAVLDANTNKLRSLNHIFSSIPNKRLRVITINQAKDGMMWIGTWGNGVFVFDPIEEKLITHYPATLPIYSIIRDQYDNMWYVGNSRLHKYDPSEGRLLTFNTKNLMYNLIEDKERDKIWMVGTRSDQVFLESFDYETQEIEQHPVNFNARYVKAMALDHQNRLWLGSWGDGLYISNSEVNHFERINTNPQGGNFDNINYSIILDIDIDNNGIAWMGTSHGGVLILYPNKGFKLLKANANYDRIDQNIVSMFKDRLGKLYKGSLTDGLYVQDKSGDFKKISNIISAKINTFYEHGNTLFIGTAFGLYIIKNNDFSSAKRYIPIEKVTSILLDSKNRLWLGTQERGLKMTDYQADPELRNLKIYSETENQRTLDNNRISHVKEDDKGNIWLATYAGLNLYDEENDKFYNQQSLISQRATSIIINDIHISDDKIYLGTPTGLSILSYKDYNLKLEAFFDKDKGLINDFICAIEEDRYGNLWLSTTTTITKYQKDLKNFINYDREDGVMINSFHISSSLQDSDGMMYFGGSNGIITFDPYEIPDEFNIPEIVFTKLIVNNKHLEVGEEVDGHVVLSKVIQKTDRINLGYAQNHLSLSFTANDFFGPDNITYAYKLTGLQNDWINLGVKNEINFTGLRSGKYELLVKASRNNQDWSEAKKLEIIIDTPPWYSWWAFLIYAFLVVSILILVRHYSSRQAILKAELRIIQIEKEKEHELNEAKITFFTNISHEFRTPLTLILSPVIELIESYKLDEAVKEKLKLVENNSKRMLNLINQLLDFRKSEHGLLKLKITNSDFIEFSKEVFLNFKSIAAKKKISYHFDSNVDSFKMNFDRDQMEIVINNFLSNAFKYTKDKGIVRLEIEVFDNQIQLMVKDTGIGLSEENKEKIFNRFFQVHQTDLEKIAGSGIGLAFSKNIVDLHGGQIKVDSLLNSGTTFTICLPLNKLDGAFVDMNLIEKSIQSFGLHENLSSEVFEEETIEEDGKLFTVLVADDNEDIRAYLKELLKEDYHILESEDGAQALKLIHQEIPDLVISDVMMPNMDGITLCQELKSQISTSHIPIILLTARTSLDYELEGLQTGAEDYITKPFNPGIVKTKIANILENRKKLREYFFNKVRFEPDTQEVHESNIDADFIEKAIRLVNDNLQNDAFGIEMMVNELFMSQSTLFRKIKSLTGMSLTGFIRSIKLKAAAQLILQTDMKLSQVAHESGFNDYKYFKKSFESQFGCLPSEYKNKILQSIK
ncbi:hybrid sensor histidine kinase/response regulator transcription factor [Belliella pelovolcani]|uniref:histidine kinase n=1 Tax=Belliella pelovolcani TaxID=529505 RepID=A0A1N7LRC6_9BACT|nr:two-component regulator propeller domain-containing protein [Belliella pelovolcani]SIS76319.1 Signal transduction histidine kinase [Belliella pelovolcani]